MNKSKTVPVYQLLVEYLKKGFSVLDTDIQQEIITFVRSQQNQNGGFNDRAGNPDLYYSLFGLWLSLATGQNESLSKLKKYCSGIELPGQGPVEQMALILTKAALEPKTKRRSVFSLLRMLNQQGKNISLWYRFFLFALLVDALGKNKTFYYFLARIYLIFFHPKPDFPCSLVAAFTYARKMMGLPLQKSHKLVMNYYVKSGGFKAFDTTSNSDMLSTAVALFVLKEIAADLRLIRPATLGFVQNNYFEGAFLSGDGDETKDLEYTFYGLLALGSLVNNEK
ncbi:prenyltransferase/squalene oxidase repeat-containing protein [Maribellus sediminis]|uniref:prenyltransferase/squalene oxidase repeat-containing protein n=1 Tax=Maribellus sediminis TaxID=2696285 RepID=UPI00142FC941|nr:prenyltransferase/squalene oxidase repeat-containing protein [Maribellus sediminis]